MQTDTEHMQDCIHKTAYNDAELWEGLEAGLHASNKGTFFSYAPDTKYTNYQLKSTKNIHL